MINSSQEDNLVVETQALMEDGLHSQERIPLKRSQSDLSDTPIDSSSTLR